IDDPTIPQGQVISTSPTIGQKVGSGTTVDINISTGKVKLPPLYGKTKDEATQALKDASPTLIAVFKDEENAVVEAGKITAQSPTDGTEVSQGST
ncbi:serine/threonine protein kinase, partial [Vibrio vulnificus]